MIHLTIITPTHNRHKHLSRTIMAVKRQVVQGQIEHIVVADGHDPIAEAICDEYSVPYYALPEHMHGWGAGCRDKGIEQARGEYVAFWDDDNDYELDAAESLLMAAKGFDIGVVQTFYHQHIEAYGTGFVRLPRDWHGQFICGEIDTMCACVARETARRAKWADNLEPTTDYHWLHKLQQQGATVNFVPIVIGRHL